MCVEDRARYKDNIINMKLNKVISWLIHWFGDNLVLVKYTSLVLEILTVSKNIKQYPEEFDLIKIRLPRVKNELS